MNKHTEGPWERYGYIGRAGLTRVQACIGEEDRTGRKIYKDLPITEADARLIAASPDLLAAAKGLFDAAGKSPALAMAFGSQHGLPAAMALKAAIDKAETQ